MYKLLKQILKELQAIRSYLEPKNVTIKIDGKTILSPKEMVKECLENSYQDSHE